MQHAGARIEFWLCCGHERNFLRSEWDSFVVAAGFRHRLRERRETLLVHPDAMMLANANSSTRKTRLMERHSRIRGSLTRSEP